MVFAHHGFEPLSSIAGLWRAVPLQAPVRVRITRHRRDDVPDDEAGLVAWLDEQWLDLDRWVAAGAADAVAGADPRSR